MFTNPVIIQLIQAISAIVTAVMSGTIVAQPTPVDFSNPAAIVATIAGLIFVAASGWSGELTKRASLTRHGELDVPTSKLRQASRQLNRTTQDRP